MSVTNLSRKVVLSTGFVLMSFSSNVFGGQVVYKNGYARSTLVQGVGKTKQLAIKDAEKSIPTGYVKDSNNSPTSHCKADSDEIREIAPDGTCPQRGVVVFTIPILVQSN